MLIRMTLFDDVQKYVKLHHNNVISVNGHYVKVDPGHGLIKKDEVWLQVSPLAVKSESAQEYLYVSFFYSGEPPQVRQSDGLWGYNKRTRAKRFFQPTHDYVPQGYIPFLQGHVPRLQTKKRKLFVDQGLHFTVAFT